MLLAYKRGGEDAIVLHVNKIHPKLNVTTVDIESGGAPQYNMMVGATVPKKTKQVTHKVWCKQNTIHHMMNQNACCVHHNCCNHKIT